MKRILVYFLVYFNMGQSYSQITNNIINEVDSSGYCIFVNVNIIGDDNSISINIDENVKELLYKLEPFRQLSKQDSIIASIENISERLNNVAEVDSVILNQQRLIDLSTSLLEKLDTSSAEYKALSVEYEALRAELLKNYSINKQLTCQFDNLRIVKIEGRTYVIGDDIEVTSEDIIIFEPKEGITKVKLHNKFGFIDFNWNFIVEPKYDEASDYSCGYSLVKNNGYYYYIDKTGGVLVSDENWVQAYSFKDGVARVAKAEIRDFQNATKFNYLDTSGKYISSFWFNQAYDFNLGLGPVTFSLENLSEYNYREFVKEFKFLKDRRTDRFGVVKRSVYPVGGYINSKGSFVIAPKFGETFKFNDFGTACAATYNSGIYTLINQEGSIVSDNTYEHPFETFVEGMSISNNNIINETGLYVVKDIYDTLVGDFKDSLLVVGMKQNNDIGRGKLNKNSATSGNIKSEVLFGIINRNGAEIHQCKWIRVERIGEKIFKCYPYSNKESYNLYIINPKGKSMLLETVRIDSG